MQNLINAGLLSTSVALITSSIIYIINNFNTKEIEIKLMSNFQKIRLSLSLAFISAFVFSILITILSFFESKKLEYNLFIGSFILSLFILMIVLLFLEISFIFILRNRKYEITLKDGSKWEIIKSTSDKGLLLKQGENYKIIKDYYNMQLTVEKIKKRN